MSVKRNANHDMHAQASRLFRAFQLITQIDVKQPSRWYSESNGELLDVVQRDVAAQPFDVGDEGAIQSGFQRQRVLRPTVHSTQSF